MGGSEMASGEDICAHMTYTEECGSSQISCDSGFSNEGCWFGNYCIDSVNSWDSCPGMCSTMCNWDLGDNWKDNFGSFSMKPFAAASIGQVHRASLPDGTEVAVKVQYPGVAKSIDSDIRNLLTLMKLLAFLPEGLFVDKIASHMAVELAQECDYKREALCGQRMKELLAPLEVYHVPAVYPELSATQVLTTEYIQGLTIDQCTTLPQNTRNLIASAVLRLCFTELFIHRYMQTDPNWD